MNPLGFGTYLCLLNTINLQYFALCLTIHRTLDFMPACVFIVSFPSSSEGWRPNGLPIPQASPQPSKPQDTHNLCAIFWLVSTEYHFHQNKNSPKCNRAVNNSFQMPQHTENSLSSSTEPAKLPDWPHGM